MFGGWDRERFLNMQWLKGASLILCDYFFEVWDTYNDHETLMCRTFSKSSAIPT